MSELEKKSPYDLLRDPHIEIATKYLLLGLICMRDENEAPLDISVETLCLRLGISKGKLYRMRSQLVRFGIIRLQKKFCSETGKKISEIYELTY